MANEPLVACSRVGRSRATASEVACPRTGTRQVGGARRSTNAEARPAHPTASGRGRPQGSPQHRNRRPALPRQLPGRPRLPKSGSHRVPPRPPWPHRRGRPRTPSRPLCSRRWGRRGPVLCEVRLKTRAKKTFLPPSSL
jgi:hypothetical protein